jgi:ATP-dependent RNA helicase RhlE
MRIKKMSFSHLSLSTQIHKALTKNHYKTPTPIQEKVVPLVQNNHDIMAKAQTGSGKSASFVLPILDYIHQNRGEGKKAKLKALILTPTRELTQQVTQTFITFGEFFSRKPKIVSVIGGEGIGNQLYDIQQGCDIVVATSGRLLDVLSKKQMDLSHLHFLVLDEADKMLNLGFEEELDLILEAIPKQRQNLLFSATYPQKILDIASKITQNPTLVTIEEEALIVENITQRAIEVNKENRAPLLRHLIQKHQFESIIVFMSNKRATDNIANKFRKHGFKASSFNADLDQENRNETLDAFKSKKFQILFATDIAARGLDIENISCVINFDLPRSPNDYIHRIGRTGRAGRTGVAISFIDHEDQAHFKLIQKRNNLNITKEQIEGFELIGEAPTKGAGPLPIKGKGKSKKDKLREKARQDSKER